MRVETATHEQELEERSGGEVPALRSRPGLVAPLRLALWRLGRGWRLLLAVGLGILVAVTLICTVPLYSSLVSNVQLQHQLSVQPPADLNIEADTTIIPAMSTTTNDVLSQAASAASQHLKSFAPTTTWYYTLGTYFGPLAIDKQQLPGNYYYLGGNPQLSPYVLNYQQALPHMNILAGRLPQATADDMPEVMVTKKMGLKPGDTISIQYNHLVMKVVGVWFPKDLNDPYWNGNGQAFDTFIPPCHAPYRSCPADEYPVLFDQATFFDLFGFDSSAPTSAAFSMAIHTISFTAPANITVATAANVINAIQDYKAQLNGTLYSDAGVNAIGVGTNLGSLLQALQQQFNVLTQPLYIIIAQVVGLALLFVVAMASLLIEAQAGDIATLKSRGASLTQLLTNYTLQGLGVAALAVLAGPSLAAGLSLLILRYYVPISTTTANQPTISANYLAKLVSSQMVLKPALAGALLGLAALIIAAWLASRRDVLAFRREAGRNTETPFWKRYYLDLALVLLCAAGYLELGAFGGLNVRQQLGQSSSTGADPFQLITPGLLLLGGALLALRFFPLATKLGAWVAAKARGATSMLAFAQLERSATQFSRLTLLLTLAVGLGVFALTFQYSIRTNAIDQSQFLVGSDENVVLKSLTEGTPLTAPFQPIIASMPGVKSITPVYSTTVTNPNDDLNASLLAINPTSFAQTAYWRSDYASQPLTMLMSQMQAHARGATAGDQEHPIWALIDKNFAQAYSLASGVVFTLVPEDSSSATLFFVVGAVVNNVPTQSDASVTGFIVCNIADYGNALAGPQGAGGFINFNGPNQYWLRTNGNAADDARRKDALQNPNLWVDSVIDRKTLEAQAIADPLAAGMSGLLLAGALIAALLAVLGSIIQSGVAARQRLTQFAILRTLGGQKWQLLSILLSQQFVVYFFSLLVGTMLGVILSTATLPFLQFSTSAINTTQRLPAYLLAFNPTNIAFFSLALVLAFVLALLIGAQVALRGGLGKTLRIGED